MEVQQLILERGTFQQKLKQRDRGDQEVPEDLVVYASSAKCVSFDRLFDSRPQSNFVGAGFRRSYVLFELRIILVALHGGSSIPLFCFDHFSADAAFTPIHATCHQLVSLCRSVCVEEGAQIFDPIVTR